MHPDCGETIVWTVSVILHASSNIYRGSATRNSYKQMPTFAFTQVHGKDWGTYWMSYLII